jgi:WhiB family transcriptional regulator, redox-sensing transcriptional regulator
MSRTTGDVLPHRLPSRAALRCCGVTDAVVLPMQRAPKVPAVPPVAALNPESLALPCALNDSDMWFAEAPSELERAKALCLECPVRTACLAGAVERREPAGVWGGEIFDNGRILARKRPRGRPRKDAAA